MKIKGLWLKRIYGVIGIKVSALEVGEVNLDFRYCVSLKSRHMFKTLFFFLTFGLVAEFSFAQATFAQATFAPGEPGKMMEDSPAKITKPKKIKHTIFDVGADLRSYTYEEPGFVKHSGLMYGIWGNYVTRTDWGTFGVDSTYSFGKGIMYDGGLCDTQTNTCSPYQTTNQTDIISKTNAVAYLPASEVLRFKAGLGYRYYSDSVAEPGFYLRTGTYLYIPLAAEIFLQDDNVYKWKFELGYDYVVSGGIKSNLSEVRSSFSDVVMSQTGYGLNMNVQLRYLGRYSGTFFYETWNLDVSDVVYASPSDPFREPANKSTAIGFKFGYDFY